jgi:hypothetical protein
MRAWRQTIRLPLGPTPPLVAEIYADHDVARAIVGGLRARRHVVTITTDLGLQQASDDVQLLTAAERGWLFITHNRNDFTLLRRAWRRWSSAWGVEPRPRHHGILILPQGVAHPDVAREVHRFLRRRLPLANELYDWNPPNDWVRIE